MITDSMMSERSFDHVRVGIVPRHDDVGDALWDAVVYSTVTWVLPSGRR